MCWAVRRPLLDQQYRRRPPAGRLQADRSRARVQVAERQPGQSLMPVLPPTLRREKGLADPVGGRPGGGPLGHADPAAACRRRVIRSLVDPPGRGRPSLARLLASARSASLNASSPLRHSRPTRFPPRARWRPVRRSVSSGRRPHSAPRPTAAEPVVGIVETRSVKLEWLPPACLPEYVALRRCCRSTSASTKPSRVAATASRRCRARLFVLGLLVSSRHTPGCAPRPMRAQLVQLGDAEPVRVADHHHRRVRHVHPHFDHRGGHQDVGLAGREAAHHRLL